MRIDVDKVPRRAKAMSPYEVMLSESQERMLVVARPGRESDVERVFKRWELHGVRVGEITENKVLTILERRRCRRVASAGAARGRSARVRHLEMGRRAAKRRRGRSRSRQRRALGGQSSRTHKIGLELLDLLASPAVASRAVIYRTYDQMVGTDTVLGPGADAALLRIKGRSDGIAIAIDAQPRVAALDPFVGAASAVAEALRNIVCVGAEPLAITDCLNLGNPERPEGAWQLERTIAGISAACARARTSRSSPGTCRYITRRAARTSGRPR